LNGCAEVGLVCEELNLKTFLIFFFGKKSGYFIRSKIASHVICAISLLKKKKKSECFCSELLQIIFLLVENITCKCLFEINHLNSGANELSFVILFTLAKVELFLNVKRSLWIGCWPTKPV
jgi:hypothetical protein